MENLNEQLKELYSKNWDVLLEELDSDKLEVASSYPLLIKINEKKYEKSNFKWMVFGKETNGWDVYDGTIDSVLDNYYRFTDSSGNFDVDYKSFFWDRVKDFHRVLDEKAKQNTYLIYNNLLKIGKLDSGTPPKYITDIERKHFSVIKDEINILKPDMLLFLSGKNYDHIINDIWGDVAMDAIAPYENDLLVRINIPGVKLAMRSKHPQEITAMSKIEYEKLFNTIINQISFNIT